MPWERNHDTFAAINVPALKFDIVRVEILRVKGRPRVGRQPICHFDVCRHKVLHNVLTLVQFLFPDFW